MIFAPNSDILQNYYSEQFEKKCFESIKIKADIIAYIKWTREKIRSTYCPLPKKIPLNARISSSLVEQDVIKERVVFESCPGFYVLRIFWRPKNAENCRFY